MWKDFDFNEPYDGSFPDEINGAELPNEYIEFMRKHNDCLGHLMAFRMKRQQMLRLIY